MRRRGEILREPSLKAILADPIIRDLMAADKVDAGALRLLLDKIANLLIRHGSTAADEGPCQPNPYDEMKLRRRIAFPAALDLARRRLRYDN